MGDGELTKKITVRGMYLNTTEAALRQHTSTVHKLSDDMINVGLGHRPGRPENNIPDNTCGHPSPHVQRDRTGRNCLRKEAPFTCTPWGLATRVAYLRNGRRAMALTDICILLPRIQELGFIRLI
jgi:hypothetical protein